LPELLVRLACKHADFSWSGQQVVHLSSDFERSAPSTLYGGTKAAGASNFVRACHALGVRGVAARLFTVYGPGERSDRLLPALLGLLDTSDDLPLTDGLQQRDFTYVEDVSQGLLRLAASPAKSGEIVDLGSGRITTVREFATTVARLGGISPARLRFGALRRRVEDQRTVTAVPADTKRLRELTGWIPATTIEEGIRRTLRRQLAHSQSLTG
jgi:UDP-glucose 4-epimerase/UDP-glucuronate decarboxylase